MNVPVSETDQKAGLNLGRTEVFDVIDQVEKICSVSDFVLAVNALELCRHLRHALKNNRMLTMRAHNAEYLLGEQIKERGKNGEGEN